MDNFENFNKLTKEAKKTLMIAQGLAKKELFPYVGTEHILLGILTQKDSLGASVLYNFGISLENVNLVLKKVGRKAITGQDLSGPGGLSGYAKEVLESSYKLALEFGHAFVGTEHLLFSLCSQKGTSSIVILENMNVSPDDIKAQILEIFDKAKGLPQMNGDSAFPNPAMNDGMPPQNMINPVELFLNGLQNVMSGQGKNKSYNKSKDVPGSSTPALDYFTKDLILAAKNKELAPVVGREKEVNRLISIISRKTKNNPVLIGESGVGKTAIVEGFAQAILEEKVPDNILDKKILSLSMAGVVAGTKYRGEFEERIKQIIEEAESSDNIILFIDELHTVIGAGSAEGSLDAANILKPALSRGKFQVIGATTTSEYRKNVEKDPALERRFQTIMVEEPNEEVAIEMLKGLQESFEDHHNIVISEDAITSSVILSKRYINDRFLPDKAIDLIDEAAAKKRIGSKKSTDKVKKAQKKLNAVIAKKEQAVRNQDYELAAELRNDEIFLLKTIEELKFEKTPRNKREILSAEDIAVVVSGMTGVPVTKLVSDDINKLRNLELSLKKRIVGQDEAVHAISQAIRRSRAGFADERRPIGSFIFLGPTGVGKTELVKALAEEIYNDSRSLIKIDMSEFMERHNTSRLIGATAGYVGYEEGGQLTEAVRKKPYSVLLFDEIEKAHPDVFNLLLQILEDGELTDAKGRRVDFRNTIIIMTSNIGAKRLTDSAVSIGFSGTDNEYEKAMNDYNNVKDDILEDLKDHFRPEFLNRIDKVVVFKALTPLDIEEIVKLHLSKLQKRVINRNIKISPTKGALELLSKKGFDPKFGARPVRRAIQELVEDPLTQKFLEGYFHEGDKIKLVKNGEKVEIVAE
jgi:ATP-dependent Clp protease ATP-binding subunit ClpC